MESETDQPGVTRAVYRVTCTRSGGWWAIEVPEIRGLFSQSGDRASVEAMAREAIALMLAVDPDSFDVEVTETS